MATTALAEEQRSTTPPDAEGPSLAALVAVPVVALVQIRTGRSMAAADAERGWTR